MAFISLEWVAARVPLVIINPSEITIRQPVKSTQEGRREGERRRENYNPATRALSFLPFTPLYRGEGKPASRSWIAFCPLLVLVLPAGISGESLAPRRAFLRNFCELFEMSPTLLSFLFPPSSILTCFLLLHRRPLRRRLLFA